MRTSIAWCLGVCVVCLGAVGYGQMPQSPAAPKMTVERLGPDLYRIGTMKVDTAKRVVSITGVVNQVTVLEFVANAKGGIKAYETALTLDTDAVNFNVALVLIGLDKAHAKVSKQHFDPTPVTGDPVELTIEWTHEGEVQRAPIERLLYDQSTNQSLPPGDWVYTGSTFNADGRYLAELEGTLIGFAHTPSSVIESVRGVGLNRYGTIVLNPHIGVKGLLTGAPLTLHIRSLTARTPDRERTENRKPR